MFGSQILVLIYNLLRLDTALPLKVGDRFGGERLSYSASRSLLFSPTIKKNAYHLGTEGIQVDPLA